MMFEEVMIQQGVRRALEEFYKSAGGWGGGGSPPHDVRRSDDSVMIKEVMIQERVR